MENTRRYRKLRDMTIRDSLTGLYNQRYFYRSLAVLVEKCNAEERCFFLIFMDIDDFKTVVDTQGHLNGSRTLREISQNIQGCLKDASFAVALIVESKFYGQLGCKSFRNKIWVCGLREILKRPDENPDNGEFLSLGQLENLTF